MNTSTTKNKNQILTVVLHVYNNNIALSKHIEKWLHLDEKIKSSIEFIVIDDCSSPPLVLSTDINLNLTFIRVLDEIPWNMAGCKNLAACLARTNWILFSDVDYYIQEDGFKPILENIFHLDKNNLFLFNSLYKGTAITPHPNTFLVNKMHYFLVGGMDEDFSGKYGWEDIFFHACWESRKFNKILIKNISFDNFGESTSGLDRDDSQNKLLLQQKMVNINKTYHRSIIRFCWDIIFMREYEKHDMPPQFPANLLHL